ncbi:MAG: hypothetical protein AAB113_11100 [Candidatus Eisenbacteria bacterium]
MTTRFTEDRDSGAGEVALAFLTELERWVAVDLSGSAPALRGPTLSEPPASTQPMEPPPAPTL